MCSETDTCRQRCSCRSSEIIIEYKGSIRIFRNADYHRFRSVLICVSFSFQYIVIYMKYLIVGLGNIGPEYRETRHNIGFMVVDALARLNNTPFVSGRYGSTATFSIKGQQLLLLKPSTFMNLSGLAVRYWMQEEKIPLENVLIVVDDLALPFGTLRLKGKGSDAGHNGLKHIAATLGTQDYARLRFGIGNDFPRGGQIDYVLGRFTNEDLKTMDERLEMAGEIIKSFCLAGINITMNQYNKR